MNPNSQWKITWVSVNRLGLRENATNLNIIHSSITDGHDWFFFYTHYIYYFILTKVSKLICLYFIILSTLGANHSKDSQRKYSPRKGWSCNLFDLCSLFSLLMEWIWETFEAIPLMQCEANAFHSKFNTWIIGGGGKHLTIVSETLLPLLHFSCRFISLTSQFVKCMCRAFLIITWICDSIPHRTLCSGRTKIISNQ